jgi:hypothetical protein
MDIRVCVCIYIYVYIYTCVIFCGTTQRYGVPAPSLTETRCTNIVISETQTNTFFLFYLSNCIIRIQNSYVKTKLFNDGKKHFQLYLSRSVYRHFCFTQKAHYVH